MVERSAEAGDSPEVAAHPSTASGPPATTTGETPADAPTSPAGDFHNPEHWASLTGGVSQIQNWFSISLKLYRTCWKSTMQIRLLALTLQARPSQYRQVSFTTGRSMGGHITLSEETPSTGRESLQISDGG